MNGTSASIAADALRLIAGEKCSNYTSSWRCSSEGSGRTRGARYGADRWCDACVAHDALERMGVDGYPVPAWQHQLVTERDEAVAMAEKLSARAASYYALWSQIRSTAQEILAIPEPRIDAPRKSTGGAS